MISEPLYFVVHNDEDQYSMWDALRDLPAGWTSTYVGPHAACLKHIERVWQDMRPRSVREAMQSAGG